MVVGLRNAISDSAVDEDSQVFVRVMRVDRLLGSEEERSTRITRINTNSYMKVIVGRGLTIYSALNLWRLATSFFLELFDPLLQLPDSSLDLAQSSECRYGS
jgi:hypothetical protein